MFLYRLSLVSARVGDNTAQKRVNIAATRSKAIGNALILIVGVLNFHVPHFLLERSVYPADRSPAIELVFGANALGAVAHTLGIWCSRVWGWAFGVAVVALSILLYIAQGTIGLPGL